MIDDRLNGIASAKLKWHELWPFLMGPVVIALVVLTTAWLPSKGVIGSHEIYGWEWAVLAPAAALLVVCFVTRRPVFGLVGLGTGLLLLFLRGIDVFDQNAEKVAGWILLLPFGLYWVRCIVTRNFFYTVLTVAAGTLLLRELHWNPAIKVAAYPMLGLCAAWLIINRDMLAEPLRDRRHTIWLIAMVVAYGLSQLIERRVFRFVPGEAPIHSKIEEAVELAGHISLIVASLIGSWAFYDIKQSACSLKKGFQISPTGKLLAKLRGQPGSPAIGGEEFQIDPPKKGKPNET